MQFNYLRNTISENNMNIKMKISWLLGVFFLLFIFLSLSLAPVFALRPKPLVIGAALKEYRQPSRRDCDIKVPRQFSTIQSAIDAAVNGETICVGRGTYNEDVTINTTGTSSHWVIGWGRAIRRVNYRLCSRAWSRVGRTKK